MTKLRVIPLVCPDCGHHLTGLRYDRVFFCLTCRQGLFPTAAAEGWDRYPLRFAETPAGDLPAGEYFFLPMWEIGIAAEAAPINANQKLACRKLEELKHVWVMGFNLIQPSYYGDLGLVYTERMISLPALKHPPDGVFVAGCTRTLPEALRYVELFVKLILDKRSDITGLGLQIRTTDAALWAVPLADFGDKIGDPRTGISFPPVAFDDLEDLRRIRKNRER